ncbi:MAG: DNA polymerase I [bacterium]|nr:DNA polymerase I [bacterium]
MKKLILIDGNALVHRAFHALPPLTSPAGLIVNAVYGFAAILLKTIKDLKPDYMVAAFDLAGKTFRHEEFEDYKAHRVKAPDELYAQIDMVKDLLHIFGVATFEKAGFEADDLIGSVAEQAKKIKDLQTIILTGDLDTLQLVVDEKVLVYTLRKGMSDTILYDEQGVRDRYGLEPYQVIDFKGLKGDPSDNIPGVPGIGDKTATALLQKYKTIEDLYKELAKIKEFKKGEVITEKLAAKLKEYENQAIFSKRLATIVRDVDIEFSLDAADWRTNISQEKLEKAFKDFGFFSLIKRIADLGLSGQQNLDLGPVVTPVKEQFKAGKNEVYFVSIDHPPTKKQLADPTQTIIGHGLKPLLKPLLAEGAELRAALFDTQIAAYLINSEFRDFEFEKVFYTVFGSSGDPQDPVDVQKLKESLWEKMKSKDLLKIFEEMEMPLIKVLAEMELRGIKIDTEQLGTLSEKVGEEVIGLEKKIHKLAGMDFNINSPQQLGEVIFNKLNLKGKIRKTGGGALSTAASELEKLRDEHPIIELIMQYRELQKLKNTYIDPFPLWLSAGDKRLHTTYNQTGTVTGRISSQDPNLQNIPIRTELGQKFRQAFIAEKGFELVSFDYSQIDLRVVAHVAQDQKMIEAFRRGEDIHTRTAVEVFEVSADKVTANMRREAKALNFGLIYGMGVLGFSRAAGVDRTRAREFITKYLNEFSGVASYMERTKAEARQKGYVKTVFGRRRDLPEILSSMPQLAAQAERMAINAPIQGTTADIMKLAMIEIDKYIEEKQWDKMVRPLLQVHDELVCEIQVGKAEEVGKEFKRIMEGIWQADVPLIADIKKGQNWAEMKKI